MFDQFGRVGIVASMGPQRKRTYAFCQAGVGYLPSFWKICASDSASAFPSRPAASQRTWLMVRAEDEAHRIRSRNKTYGGLWNTKRIGSGLLWDPKWCAKVLGVHESKHGKDVVVELSYPAKATKAYQTHLGIHSDIICQVELAQGCLHLRGTDFGGWGMATVGNTKDNSGGAPWISACGEHLQTKEI